MINKICSFMLSIIFGVIIMGSNVLVTQNASASIITSCTTSATPWGVTIDSSSSVWYYLDGKLDKTTTTSCSPSYYTITNGSPGHLLTTAGNGYVVYTLKGSGGSSSSCLSTFNPATGTVLYQQCAAGKGFDDVTADPTNSHIVWASAYYTGQIAKYDVTTNTITYVTVPLACGSLAPEPEGIRVDSFGVVWVADERCSKIFAYQGFWGSYTPGFKPWFVSIDDTNQNLYMTGYDTPPNGVLGYLDMTSGTTTTFQIPSGQFGPFAIDVDSGDNRAAVSFANNGYVNEINTSTNPKSWRCGLGDSWGTNSSPYGIHALPSSSYWVALSSSNKVGEGSC